MEREAQGKERLKEGLTMEDLYISSTVNSDGKWEFNGSCKVNFYRYLEGIILEKHHKDERFAHDKVINPSVTRLSVSKRGAENGVTVVGVVAIGGGDSASYTVCNVTLGIKVEL